MMNVHFSSLNPSAAPFVPQHQRTTTASSFVRETQRHGSHATASPVGAVRKLKVSTLDADVVDTNSVSSDGLSDASTELEDAPRSRFGTALDAFAQRHGASAHDALFVEVPIRRGLELLAPLIEAALSCDSHIAGGAVRWMCSPVAQPTPTEDVDIFPPDSVRLQALEGRLLKLGYQRRAMSHEQMALSFEHPTWASPAKLVQLVLPRQTSHMNTAAADVKELLSKLDFTIARAAVVGAKRALVDVDFMRDEQLRMLRVRHIVCPISCVRRIAKYSAKGYRSRMLEIIKLFAEWSRRAEAEGAQPQVLCTPAGALGAAAEITPSRLLEAMITTSGQEEVLTGIYVD